MSKVRTLGAKPTIAMKRANDALAAIQKKVGCLRIWVEQGIPSMVREGGAPKQEWCPKSLREFAKWDGTQNSEATRVSLGALQRCSRQTLDQHPEVKQEIESLLLRLKRIPVSGNTPRDSVAELKRKLSDESKRRKAIEAAYIETRRDERDARALITRTKRIWRHEVTELRNVIQSQAGKIKILQRAINSRGARHGKN